MLNNSKRKCVLIIVDGLGDLPHRDLGGQTPLEAANTPFLDKMAAAGDYGLVDPIGRGIIPSTHSGCGILLGLIPSQISRLKRGPVEAAGAGRVLQQGEIALRANFASAMNTSGELLVTDRRAGRISQGTDQLAMVLQNIDLGDGDVASLIPTDDHRGVLIIRGTGLDASVSDTDPGDVPLPAAVLSCQPEATGAERTAHKVNRFIELTSARLQDHPLNDQRIADGLLPANCVITRGAGEWFQPSTLFAEKQMKVAVVVGCNTVSGLSRMFGFSTINDSRFTATVDTDLDAKMGSAVTALESHDMVFVHIKAPDICAHDLKPGAKREIIERLDASLEQLSGTGCMIAIAADHSTDSNSGHHTADPIPGLIFDPAQCRDSESVNFGESACRNGTMARQTSNEFLQEIVHSMGW